MAVLLILASPHVLSEPSGAGARPVHPIRVHGVVRLVAVERPVARIVGDEIESTDPELKLVDKGLARLDVRLGQAADAVHAARYQHAVPMHAGVLGKLVGDEDADLVASDAFDGRAGRLTVIAPEMRCSMSCTTDNQFRNGL